MNAELEVLKLVCNRLEGAAIDYMITGSIASNFYSIPRMTRDIDIVIEIKKKDIEQLMGLFKADFYIDEEMIRQAIDDCSMFNIIHNEHVIKIDFIVRKESQYRKLEFDRRRKIKIDNQNMQMVSPEDLVLSKLKWAENSQSEMQIRDIKNILATVKDIDLLYIEKWIRELGVDKLYAKVKS